MSRRCLERRRFAAGSRTRSSLILISRQPAVFKGGESGLVEATNDVVVAVYDAARIETRDKSLAKTRKRVRLAQTTVSETYP